MIHDAAGGSAGLRPVKVVVADDQTIVREGLVTLLGTLDSVTVVGAAASGEDAVRLVEQTAPDVVLMDLRMPGVDGIEATDRIHRLHPGTRVVVLTTYADDESIVGALRAGAIGYLTKDADGTQIGRALQAAAAGQAILDPEVQSRLVQAARLGQERRAPEPPDGLTRREVEVLALMAEGRTNAEIAETLFLGEATVKSHVNHIFAKTHSRDRAAAVAYAHRHGLAGNR